MNTREWGGDIARTRRRLGWLRRLGVAMVALPLLAAAGTVGFKVAQWRGNSEAARCIATNAHAAETERVQAMVGMRRDIDLSIAVLHQMAKEPGAVGEQARLLLQHVRERCR